MCVIVLMLDSKYFKFILYLKFFNNLSFIFSTWSFDYNKCFICASSFQVIGGRCYYTIDNIAKRDYDNAISYCPTRGTNSQLMTLNTYAEFIDFKALMINNQENWVFI